MSTASPTAFLLWALLSVLFLGFLVHHLWCYDKFNCLRWSSGRQPGAFKRVMTYSYLGSVPLLVFYSVATTVIKYREGYTIILPENKIISTPLDHYSVDAHRWLIPLDFVFSVVWSLELVTHLEELAFWLYLLHQKPQKAEWFSSWEYRFWYLGSMVAIIGMPLTVIITRRNVITCDAYILLVGASGSTITTICFLYVLWKFPAFIRHVKVEGADPSVVVRLATFYQLNQARVVFRFLFTVPLLVISLDGIIGGPHIVNKDVFWTDFLHMVAGIGCFVSTCITLLIFFPRSITNEAGYRPKAPTMPNSPKSVITPPYPMSTQPSQMYPTSPQHTIPISVLQREADDWDDDSAISPSDSVQYSDVDQVPPYPHVSHPQYIHANLQQAVQLQQVQEDGSTVPAQYQHHHPENIAYQRHPFPHSQSSPQILSPPNSPAKPRAPMPQRRSYRHYTRRVSSVLPTVEVPESELAAAGVGLGIGTPSFDDRGPLQQGSDTQLRMVISAGQSSVTVRPPSTNLHPYVMTFTSPIDLTDIPPAVNNARPT
ncbi:hypothetical protein QCA50_005336 [Cerrena zonata]|uniref:Uncharacterized protein n=1 Tax=Cerrena zonata TaxID=2478898 RepID=A0AAW0GGN1_9APHY